MHLALALAILMLGGLAYWWMQAGPRGHNSSFKEKPWNSSEMWVKCEATSCSAAAVCIESPQSRRTRAAPQPFQGICVPMRTSSSPGTSSLLMQYCHPLFSCDMCCTWRAPSSNTLVLSLGGGVIFCLYGRKGQAWEVLDSFDRNQYSEGQIFYKIFLNVLFIGHSAIQIRHMGLNTGICGCGFYRMSAPTFHACPSWNWLKVS